MPSQPHHSAVPVMQALGSQQALVGVSLEFVLPWHCTAMLCLDQLHRYSVRIMPVLPAMPSIQSRFDGAGITDKQEGGPFLLEARQGDTISGNVSRQELAGLVATALSTPQAAGGSTSNTIGSTPALSGRGRIRILQDEWYLSAWKGKERKIYTFRRSLLRTQVLYRGAQLQAATSLELVCMHHQCQT